MTFGTVCGLLGGNGKRSFEDIGGAGSQAIRPVESHPAAPLSQASGQVLAGLRCAGYTPVLRDVLIMMALIGTLTYEFRVSLPLIAQVTYRGNAASYAILSVSFGVGAVDGGLIIGILGQHVGPQWALATGGPIRGKAKPHPERRSITLDKRSCGDVKYLRWPQTSSSERTQQR